MTQRVLITAGASGIGKEVASAYAKAGAQVSVCDINEKALDAAAKDIPGLEDCRRWGAARIIETPG